MCASYPLGVLYMQGGAGGGAEMAVLSEKKAAQEAQEAAHGDVAEPSDRLLTAFSCARPHITSKRQQKRNELLLSRVYGIKSKLHALWSCLRGRT